MTQSSYKATVEVGEKKITFEGPRDFVEQQIARITGIASKQISTELAEGHTSLSDDQRISERELIQDKQPKGHLETVVVLAFALSQAGIAEFTEDEIRRAYLRAGVRPPKVVGQALRDAKNRLDYIELGSRKGTYRLSPHGDRTVRFDLPHH